MIQLDFPSSSAGKESACNAEDLGSIPGLGRSPGEGIGYPLQYSWDSLVAQMVKKICLQYGRPGFNPWVGKIPWGGHSNPLQYSCLENDMDRETWWAIVHRVAKDQTRLERLSMHAQYLKLGREAGLFRCFVYTANKCIIAIILASFPSLLPPHVECFQHSRQLSTLLTF